MNIVCIIIKAGDKDINKMANIIQDEVVTCQDCGKKLRIKKGSKAVDILTRDQLLQGEDSKIPPPSNPPESPSKTEPTEITELASVSDLLVHPLCVECLELMIAKVDSNINEAEKIKNGYAKNITSIDNEIHVLTSKN